MKCSNCGRIMTKVDLRLSTFVGTYKCAYYCPYCEKKRSDKDEKQKRIISK